MKAVGPLSSGVSFLVERKKLIAWVEEQWRTGGQEVERRQHLCAQIDEAMAQTKATQRAVGDAGRPAVKFPVVKELLDATVDSLPAGVYLSPGQILIQFPQGEAMQACQLLYSLGMAIANDYEAFEDAV